MALSKSLPAIHRQGFHQPPSMARLNDDVFSTICSFLKTRHSLLNLALTCKAFNTIIIPKFLYARLEFENVFSSAGAEIESAVTFFDAIRRRESFGHAVRHVQIPCSENLDLHWSDTLPKMRNLRSIEIDRSDTPPALLKTISTLSRLHTLSLSPCAGESIEPLRGIRLRKLNANFTGRYNLTPDSALGEILLSSRDTLNELALSGISWRFVGPSIPMGVLRDNGDPIWPHVTWLIMLRLSDDSPVNLTYHFPSVIRFETRGTVTTMDQSYNQPFFAGLRSLEGEIGYLKLIERLGAHTKLQHAHIDTAKIFANTQLNSLPLPSTLRSLTLNLNAHSEFQRGRLGRLAAICPKVIFFSLNCGISHGGMCVDSLLAAILTHLSGLPLQCLCLQLGDSYDAHSTPGDRQEDMDMFARLARRNFPTLRFTCVTLLSNDSIHHDMRRLIDDELSEVPQEDGFDYIEYYEWRWMHEQVEECVESESAASVVFHDLLRGT
ncbi:hypothetical protein BOTBODRAFT_55485 [Botryobasidium botryosum FD-172 SS1]|uniref:Uncharacterized protein n=1 Tax=Botryobasidium botryosum (strain FD-172 SS1) TaxID=930990 RepID=A0A067MFQ8_BOTB1|nr:hypothetical protein BOTBODRAFT_55485 [Botryobasidium botryosum FD-172 SS1]